MPQCANLLPGYDKAGCIFEPFWGTPVLIQPSGDGGTNWSPVPYSPDTGYFYVSGTVRTSAYVRSGKREFVQGKSYGRGSQVTPVGSPMSGTFTAIDSTTNKIVWHHKTPYLLGGGATVTAGELVFRGEPDGNFLALDAKTGQELWRFQTGFGADAPPVVYEVDGEQCVAIATGGNSLQGSAYGDAVWAFSLEGQLTALWPPPPPSTIGGPAGLARRRPAVWMASIPPIETGVVTVKIGDNEEFKYSPARIRIKTGTTITFTNVGKLNHDATAFAKREWDTGDLASGESEAITFTQPGVYYYICTPHPWMYGKSLWNSARPRLRARSLGRRWGHDWRPDGAQTTGGLMPVARYTTLTLYRRLLRHARTNCGCNVIAVPSDRAAIEWMVYREVLPHLPVSALHGYGSVALQSVPKQR